MNVAVAVRPSRSSAYSTGASTVSRRPCVSALAPISASALSNSITLVSSRVPPAPSRILRTESWSTSSASSSSVRVAVNLKGSANSEVSESVLDRRVISKHPVERRELEDHANLLVGRREPDVALGPSDQLQRPDHRAAPGAVDEAHPFHVDDEPRRSVVLDGVADRCLQRRSAGDVEAAVRHDDGDARVRSARLDFQAHNPARDYNGGTRERPP